MKQKKLRQTSTIRALDTKLNVLVNAELRRLQKAKCEIVDIQLSASRVEEVVMIVYDKTC